MNNPVVVSRTVALAFQITLKVAPIEPHLNFIKKNVANGFSAPTERRKRAILRFGDVSRFGSGVIFCEKILV